MESIFAHCGTALPDKAIKEAVTLAKLIGSELILLYVREPHDRPLQTEGSGIISPPRRFITERQPGFQKVIPINQATFPKNDAV